MSEKRPMPYGTILVFGLWGVLLLLVFWWMYPDKPIPAELQGIVRPHPKPLQAFELVDHRNQPFTREQLQASWSFVFFGYTYCPDICPTTLSTLTAVNKRLNSESLGIADHQVVFVSVDPARDSPEVLAEYVKYFDKEFVGITGKQDAIDHLARQFNAGYVKEPETQPGQYLVSHASTIFLVDPAMRLVAAFPPPHDPNTIVDLYRKIRARY